MADLRTNPVLDMLFPPVCSFCRRLFRQEESPFSGACRPCLNRLPLRIGSERLVPLRAAADSGTAAICACYYEDHVRETLVRMKFSDAPEVSATFADLLADAILRVGSAIPFTTASAIPTGPTAPTPPTVPTGPTAPAPPAIPAFTAIAAVPLHPARERERGYNQAALIAAALGRRLLLPDWSTGLERIRSTGRQSELLTMAERRNNVAGAFSVKWPSRFAHQHLILVDDILSTGSTILATRQAILDAGAASVTLAAVASGYRLRPAL